MPKLSLYARQRIVTLYFTNGVNVTNIAKLLKEEGIKVSRSAVSLFVSRYKKSRSLQDANNKMKENDELTSKELQEQLLEEHNIQLSVSSIRRVKRNVLDWKSENARYFQFVREPNKMKRLVFCLNALVNKDTFEDVIFTDETSGQIEQHARICFRKKR